jgi:NAD(P)-dependent dehydrogenase (short-subunit alcohol dehydrogenase family)
VGRLTGRVTIVTGAGRGLGREHALLMAKEGAAVVVNDLGSDTFGQGAERSPAESVVAEIKAASGTAVASHHDISDWDQALELVRFAIATFGDLHVVVNNAGILRDRALANMNEGEWDAVIRVHLKGHAAMSRHAVAYWRDRAKSGNRVKASVIHTTSVSGLLGNFGQANYGAAKLGIVALSRIIAMEGAKYGVRSNAVSPSARTRMTAEIPGADVELAPPADPTAFDPFHPGNVSPVIAWLAEENCPANSQIFQVIANRIYVMTMPTIAHRLDADGRWTADRLDRELPSKLVTPLPTDAMFKDLLG